MPTEQEVPPNGKGPQILEEVIIYAAVSPVMVFFFLVLVASLLLLDGTNVPMGC
jgi:hypothetical protein